MLRIPTAFLTLALGAALYGCVDNESSLFIEGVLALPATDCVARPDPEATFLTRGVLDVQFASGYVAAVQVGNQLTQQGNREKTRTETARIHLQGAKGTVYDVQGGTHPFEAIATGFVHPAAGTDPGLAAMFVNLVGTDMLADLAAAGDGDAAVRFRVYGRTLGGQDIESGDYDYPITICNGCLIDYPISALDPAAIPPDYLCGSSAEADEEAAQVCFIGQDQKFSCTLCAAVNEVCHDPDLNPWLQ